MKRLLDRSADGLAALGGLMLVVFTVIVAYQVMSRYVGLVPRVFWTEEVSRFSFIWMLFLGAAVAVYRGTHFVIDLFQRPATRRGRVALELAPCVAAIIVALVMVFGGTQFVQMGLSRTSTVSGIRLAWIYAAIPFCGAWIIAFSLYRLLCTWQGRDASNT